MNKIMAEKSKPLYFDFDEYIRQGEPEAAKSAEQWNTAIGLQADLWQIHAFCEGNTRTTAVFLIQYLRSIGYKVNNDLFAHHSWYFRNALVRANYKNSKLGINYDYQYLERFFFNLLLGEHYELKNRYLVIDAPDHWNTIKPGTDHTPKDKEETDNVGSASAVQLTERQKSIYKFIKNNPQVSTAEMSVVLSVVKRTIERDISKLRGMGIITREGNTSAGKWVILKEV